MTTADRIGLVISGGPPPWCPANRPRERQTVPYTRFSHRDNETMQISSIHSTYARRRIFVLVLILATVAWPSRALDASAAIPWTSAATLHHLPRSTHGSLTISADGVQFQTEKAPPIYWSFIDIRNVDLTNSQVLAIVTYQNQRWHLKHWHLPGDRRFVFHLTTAMPPEVAAKLVGLVGKPAINGVPFPEASTFAVLPARHMTRTGGSNGTLRFRDAGIDYVVENGKDSRTWRWTDIQTIAHPEPYRLRIGAYLEEFDLELKKPLPDEIFDRLWDLIYGRGLNITQFEGERNARIQ